MSSYLSKGFHGYRYVGGHKFILFKAWRNGIGWVAIVCNVVFRYNREDFQGDRRI